MNRDKAADEWRQMEKHQIDMTSNGRDVKMEWCQMKVTSNENLHESKMRIKPDVKWKSAIIKIQGLFWTHNDAIDFIMIV